MTNSQLTVLLPGASQAIELMQKRNKTPVLFSWLKRAKKTVVDADINAVKFTLLLEYILNPLPVARMTACTDGLMDSPFWMRADPVSLQVDIAHVYQLGNIDLALTAKESASIAQVLNPLLEVYGLVLSMPAPNRWYVCPVVDEGLQTVCPNSILAKPIVDELPKGPRAKHWQLLFTEIQMALYDCEVNQARRLNGQQTVDALWFWGQGTHNLKDYVIPFDQVCSNDAVATGIAKYVNFPVKSFNGDYQYQGNCLICDERFLKTFESDELMLSAIEECFTQLIALLADEKSLRLVLYPGNKHCYYVCGKTFKPWWQSRRKYR